MKDIDIVKNVKASFAMEGLRSTKEDEERGLKILRGDVDIRDVIAEIKAKYVGDSDG